METTLPHGNSKAEAMYPLYYVDAELQELCLVYVSGRSFARPRVPDWLRFGCEQVSASAEEKLVEGYLQVARKKPTCSSRTFHHIIVLSNCSSGLLH
jgi:hypothetical protein